VILKEGVRKTLAFAGCGLWLASSFMPFFGGLAKHQVQCRGRSFTGDFDDCFNDYIPLLELSAPLFALAGLYIFMRLAFAIWSPEPGNRRMRWRLAPKDGIAVYHPGYAGLAVMGGLWAFWRATLYPLDGVTAPFIGFWLSFAVWFLTGACCAWRAGADETSPRT
jgi:hypothetical protein